MKDEEGRHFGFILPPSSFILGFRPLPDPRASVYNPTA
jgi:hypothetical protein